MSIRTVRRPLYAMNCDAADCPAELRGDWEYGLKDDARRMGWQLRPARGKGSRTAPDLCPEHRTEDGTR
ncbi:hypothetical protein PSN13_06540 [Micromonospora saelicesensis]|uniref:Uncharacterized protein n=1 Tax=Micromonospora saelicesensis TaxID=285676 RepID=A0A328NFD2_9ACTN|nr:hypothetical protein [Micromonospora saelicesensis]RAO26512.1 hypothetical protein PSN13_06540 [Micromonospora saelicesensis]